MMLEDFACRSCGYKNKEQMNFCPQCGARQKKKKRKLPPSYLLAFGIIGLLAFVIATNQDFLVLGLLLLLISLVLIGMAAVMALKNLVVFVFGKKTPLATPKPSPKSRNLENTTLTPTKDEPLTNSKAQRQKTKNHQPLQFSSKFHETVFGILSTSSLVSLGALFVAENSLTPLAIFITSFVGACFFLRKYSITDQQGSSAPTSFSYPASFNRNVRTKRKTRKVIWRGRMGIEFDYVDYNGDHTERDISLTEIVERDHDYKLSGYCHLREMPRTFVSDGIISPITHKGRQYVLDEFIQKCVNNEF